MSNEIKQSSPIPFGEFEGGWKVEYSFLKKLTEKVNEQEHGDDISMEQVEAVLLTIKSQLKQSSPIGDVEKFWHDHCFNTDEGYVINKEDFFEFAKIAGSQWASPRWVKASERLPENNRLVHINYNTTETNFKTTGRYENGGWFRQDGSGIKFWPSLQWLEELSEPICDYCGGTGYDSYPNHSTTYAVCPKCEGTTLSNPTAVNGDAENSIKELGELITYLQDAGLITNPKHWVLESISNAIEILATQPKAAAPKATAVNGDEKSYQHRDSIRATMWDFFNQWAEKDSPELLEKAVDYCMSLVPYPKAAAPKADEGIVWKCTKNGVRRYGESCNLNNNCGWPKCLESVDLNEK